MQIAELFVALGVKGSEKTLSALANTRLSISSIASTSLEAKAAILGMAYALERLTTGAATDASNLKNFAAFIDSSAEDIERWDYAAKRAGLSAESMNNSIRGVYKMIQDNLTTPEKLPPGAKIFAEETLLNITNPLDYQDILRKAVQFSHSKRYSQPVKNAVLQSLGLGSDLIGAIESGQFKLSNVDHAPILSNKEVDSLANVKSQFEGIEEEVRLFFGHFTAAHGTEIVKIIKDMTTAFLGLADVFIIIADKFEIFKAIDTVFKAWKTDADILKNIFNGNSGADSDRNKAFKELAYWQEKQRQRQEELLHTENKEFKKIDDESIKKIGDFFTGIQSGAHSGLSNLVHGGIDLIFSAISLKNATGDSLNSGFGEFKTDFQKIFNRNGYDILKGAPIPSVPERYGLSPKNTTVNVTQNLTMAGDPTDYNDIQNMHQNAAQKMIVDTMSQFDRGRQT